LSSGLTSLPPKSRTANNRVNVELPKAAPFRYAALGNQLRKTFGGYFIKSTAALNITHHLGGMWRMLYLFILVLRTPRDAVYDLIARYRYQSRGTLTTCFRSHVEYKDRFLYDV
jgi:predicted DCC family thiol-disulfide oxidoreductase YuxK